MGGGYFEVWLVRKTGTGLFLSPSGSWVDTRDLAARARVFYRRGDASRYARGRGREVVYARVEWEL